MIRPLVFLIFCSMKNRVLLRVKKLRRPKYLISALAGIGYLCFVFLNQAHLNRSPITAGSPVPNQETMALAETGFALMILAVVIFQWFSAGARHVLFGEAEIQFFFAAPLSPHALFHYRIARAQTGILFGSAVTTLVLGRGVLFPRWIYLFTVLWILYSLLYLYRVAVVLSRRRLEKHGWDAARFQIALVGTAVLLLAAIAVRWHKLFPSLPPLSEMSPQEVPRIFAGIAQSGPIGYLLSPFRILVRPAFASALPDFALRLIPSLLTLLLVYGWARLSSVDLREAALGLYAVRRRKTTDRQIKKGARRSGRPLFPLPSRGPAWMAVYWKNLSLASGLNSHRTLPALAAVTIFCILMAGASGEEMSMIFGGAALGLAGFITILGPVIFREDLRTDLKNMDLLKMYPMPGLAIAIGEVLAPATVLAVLEWVPCAYSRHSAAGCRGESMERFLPDCLGGRRSTSASVHQPDRRPGAECGRADSARLGAD